MVCKNKHFLFEAAQPGVVKANTRKASVFELNKKIKTFIQFNTYVHNLAKLISQEELSTSNYKLLQE